MMAASEAVKQRITTAQMAEMSGAAIAALSPKGLFGPSSPRDLALEQTARIGFAWALAIVGLLRWLRAA